MFALFKDDKVTLFVLGYSILEFKPPNGDIYYCFIH